MILSLALSVGLMAYQQGESRRIAPTELVNHMASIQPDLEDFRCEYEGNVSHAAKNHVFEKKLDADGVEDIFGGIYVWQSGGNTFSDTFHRHKTDGKIYRDTLVIREGQVRDLSWHWISRLERRPSKITEW